MSLRSLSLMLLFPSFIFIVSSCSSYKEVPLFQDAIETEMVSKIQNFSPARIQANDLLGLGVSSLNPDAAEIFKPPSMPVNGGTVSQPRSDGFLVDSAGNINIPYVGRVAVAGLNSSEAAQLIMEKLKPYLKEPVVNVQILNFKVGVFGGVSAPGIYSVQNERINVLEALILAGDMELTALRSNVLLIRESEGERKLIRLDLRTVKSLESPYYYLQTNDLIYVEPGTSTEKRTNLLGTVSIGVSIVSLLIILARF